MIELKGEYTTKDRWPLKVIKLGPGESRAVDYTKDNDQYTSGTHYVLLRNSDFIGDNVKFENVNAAFSVNHHYTVRCGKQGSAVIIQYPGLRLLENRYYVQNELDMGNLSYMDGGTNTTAVNPGRLGDPVVNYVHFPAGMYQTLHTHPSHRVGLVLKGNGRVELDNKQFFNIKEGEAFFMRRNELHNFITDDEPVILFVFAPDSGTGPTDEVNPLKIRTYVGQQRFHR
jgi:quercetin dioxygenase-like cupin family protein